MKIETLATYLIRVDQNVDFKCNLLFPKNYMYLPRINLLHKCMRESLLFQKRFRFT